MELAERLRTGAAELGVALDDEQTTRFERYLALLLTWNQRINLTAIREPLQIVDRHFLDSLTIVPSLAGARSLVDVGAGAGFPGAVAAIACPGLRATCIDSVHKKVAFLQTLRRELGLDLEPIAARDTALAGRTFEAAVSRATWDPQEWLVHGAPLVAPKGLLLAMQSEAQAMGSLSVPSGFEAEPARWFNIAGARRCVQAFRRT
jgi:16S rRNA (guanine527-N7)-methyltransferase